MQQRMTRVNASEETIKIGPLGIRFLLTGAASAFRQPHITSPDHRDSKEN